MASPWTFSGQVSGLDPVGGGERVTLVDESTFVISDRAGDLTPGGTHGLFVRDSRVVSRLELRVDGRPLEPLAAVTHDPFSATFVGRTRPEPGRADSSLLVFRARSIGQGMREDLTIHNFGDEATVCLVEYFVDADFADLFAVKEGRGADADGDVHRTLDGSTLTLAYRRGGTTRAVEVQLRVDQADEGAAAEAARTGPVAPTVATGATLRLAENLLTVDVLLPARSHWSACLEVTPVIGVSGVADHPRTGPTLGRATPSERLDEWRQSVPQIKTEHEGLAMVLRRSAEDLGALRIFDQEFPDRVVVAAGAPWFMTVFGRDSLLTAWMALLMDPDLALGVLQTLARFQGTDVDPRHDEQPGRILHEMRFGSATTQSLGGGSIYYGSADATPLFVMLLGELRRWGLAPGLVDELMPNADRALAWIADYGDADGDGYVEYQRQTDRGLANQGWKDSWDGIRYADGRVAQAPIALCEVQAYVYGAYLARAHFASEAGDAATFDRYRRLAADLKAAFNRDFWLPEQGWFAVGLDADKRPIDSLTSNMGHCLWTGIVDEEKAAAVARHLVGPSLFSGWGVRTLGATMPGYNPVSYHCGSVWPHDSAIAAAGLARYGFEEAAQRVVTGLLEAAVTQGGRLPELFTGLDRGRLAVPVGYPTSCSPQAWSAASPLLCLRTLLRFDPWVPYGKTWLAPMIPAAIGALRVERIPLAGARVDVDVAADGTVTVEGLPPGIELVQQPRVPMTAV